MRVKRPLLVTFIGDLNLISIFFIMASFFPTPQFIEKIGFSFIPSLIALIITYPSKRYFIKEVETL